MGFSSQSRLRIGVKIKNYRYTMQKIPLYDAENYLLYRYTMQKIPLYDAENTVIRCSVFSLEIREGDFMRSYEIS